MTELVLIEIPINPNEHAQSFYNSLDFADQSRPLFEQFFFFISINISTNDFFLPNNKYLGYFQFRWEEYKITTN